MCRALQWLLLGDVPFTYAVEERLSVIHANWYIKYNLKSLINYCICIREAWTVRRRVGNWKTLRVILKHCSWHIYTNHAGCKSYDYSACIKSPFAQATLLLANWEIYSHCLPWVSCPALWQGYVVLVTKYIYKINQAFHTNFDHYNCHSLQKCILFYDADLL